MLTLHLPHIANRAGACSVRRGVKHRSVPKIFFLCVHLITTHVLKCQDDNNELVYLRLHSALSTLYPLSHHNQ